MFSIEAITAVQSEDGTHMIPIVGCEGPLSVDPRSVDFEKFKELSLDQRRALLQYCPPHVRYSATAHFPLEEFVHPDLTNGNVALKRFEKTGVCTIAARDLPEAGALLCSVRGIVLSSPTLYTIQTGLKTHVVPHGGCEFLAHSCDPTVKLVTDDADPARVDVVTLRPLHAGEVLSFNYLTTEFSMDAPFVCHCGSEQCVGRIAGFEHLGTDLKDKLRPFCTNAVLLMEKTHATEPSVATGAM
eukprot:PhM_4_TR10921/c0_g1_i1/m.7997